jgi:hypothetical protein
MIVGYHEAYLLWLHAAHPFFAATLTFDNAVSREHFTPNVCQLPYQLAKSASTLKTFLPELLSVPFSTGRDFLRGMVSQSFPA